MTIVDIIKKDAVVIAASTEDDAILNNEVSGRIFDMDTMFSLSR